jgi:hypothetical protein
MYGVLGIRLIVGSSRWPSRPNPWVARLMGLDDRWRFQRKFVRGYYDYTYSTKGTGKNTYMYFPMPPGIYEVYYPTSWKHEFRGFIQVDETGDLHEITHNEVIECLKNTISE